MQCSYWRGIDKRWHSSLNYTISEIHHTSNVLHTHTHTHKRVYIYDATRLRKKNQIKLQSTFFLVGLWLYLSASSMCRCCCLLNFLVFQEYNAHTHIHKTPTCTQNMNTEGSVCVLWCIGILIASIPNACTLGYFRLWAALQTSSMI